MPITSLKEMPSDFKIVPLFQRKAVIYVSLNHEETISQKSRRNSPKRNAPTFNYCSPKINIFSFGSYDLELEVGHGHPIQSTFVEYSMNNGESDSESEFVSRTFSSVSSSITDTKHTKFRPPHTYTLRPPPVPSYATDLHVQTAVDNDDEVHDRNLDDSSTAISSLFPQQPLGVYSPRHDTNTPESMDSEEVTPIDRVRKRHKSVSNARERRRREGLNSHYRQLEELLDLALRTRTEKVTVLNGAIKEIKDLKSENATLRLENREVKGNIAIIADCVQKAFTFGTPPFSGSGASILPREMTVPGAFAPFMMPIDPNGSQMMNDKAADNTGIIKHSDSDPQKRQFSTEQMIFNPQQQQQRLFLQSVPVRHPIKIDPSREDEVSEM